MIAEGDSNLRRPEYFLNEILNQSPKRLSIIDMPLFELYSINVIVICLLHYSPNLVNVILNFCTTLLFSTSKVRLNMMNDVVIILPTD